MNELLKLKRSIKIVFALPAMVNPDISAQRLNINHIYLSPTHFPPKRGGEILGSFHGISGVVCSLCMLVSTMAGGE